MIDSKDVENVLRFFREAEEEAAHAADEQRECEDLQNDILHDLELVDHTHNERGHMGKQLAEIRRKRRVVKDACELLDPLLRWTTIYDKAIKDLQRTLGEMRKIEDRQKNRLYRRKADGKGEVITRVVKGGP